MPSTMVKRGGGGRYGVANVRLDIKGSVPLVNLRDVDTNDQFTFTVTFDAAKGDKSHRADLVRSKQGAVCTFPATQDRAERRAMVYPGIFHYGTNAKANILYGLTPAANTHLYTFAGFVRPNDDPTKVPTWELKPGFKQGDDSRQMFGANFETADEDEFPGLGLRMKNLRYPFTVGKNDVGQDVMCTFLASDRFGDSNKSLYELLRIGGIIGRDPDTGKEKTLVDIPGNVENYLPAVEAILLRNLKGVLLNITSNAAKKDGAAQTWVNYSGLSKAVMAAAPRRGKR